VIAGSDDHGYGPSRARELLHHPALRALPLADMARDARWACGAPAMLDAVEEVAALGRAIEKHEGRP